MSWVIQITPAGYTHQNRNYLLTNNTALYETKANLYSEKSIISRAAVQPAQEHRANQTHSTMPSRRPQAQLTGRHLSSEA